MDKFLYELLRFLSANMGPFLFGGLVFSVISSIVTSKILEKRFPLKLRKVNNLKAKYARAINRIGRREKTIYFIYNLTSVFFDSIGKKIAEIEDDIDLENEPE